MPSHLCVGEAIPVYLTGNNMIPLILPLKRKYSRFAWQISAIFPIFAKFL